MEGSLSRARPWTNEELQIALHNPKLMKSPDRDLQELS